MLVSLRRWFAGAGDAGFAAIHPQASLLKFYMSSGPPTVPSREWKAFASTVASAKSIAEHYGCAMCSHAVPWWLCPVAMPAPVFAHVELHARPAAATFPARNTTTPS